MRRILGGVTAIGLGLGLTLTAAALAPGQTPAGAAAPGRAAPAPPAPAPPPPLAQFVPGENLWMLVEFAGLEAHGDAWRGSAAYKVLNSTKTGAMLESLLSQVLDQMEAVPAAARLSGAEKVTLVEHVLRHGMILAVAGKQGPADAAATHTVLVLRDAATKDARPVFGKLVGQMMGPQSKPTSQVKGTRKTVLVTPAAGTPWSWWTEKNDLVIAPAAADVDVILAALDGKAKSAVDHPLRKELAAADGPFQPIGLAFVDPKAQPAGMEASQAGEFMRRTGLDGTERADLRWGIENAALTTVLRLQAPAPRRGVLALLDQPTFTTAALPPMPASTLSFTAVSLKFDALFESLVAASRSNPQLADALDAVQRRVQERTRRRFREDVLAQLGPKLAVFSTPAKATARGPLAGLGLQVPRGAVAIEVKDPAQFSKILDELIIFANQEMDSQLPTLAPIFAPPPEKPADPNRPAPKKKGSTANPNVPRFMPLGLQTPKLYLLKLPPALGALTNLNLTVAMGKKHLVIATAADLARETIALEGKTEGRWVPAGDLADTFGRLPQGLTLLQVSDTSTTLPESLASLPATVATLNTAMAAAAAGRPLPGLNLPGLAAAPGAAPGSRSSGSGDSSLSGSSLAGDSASGGGLSSSDSSSGGLSSGSGSSSGYGSSPAPGAPGGDAAAKGPGTIALDPALAPKADDIRPLLFPGSIALSVNGPEIRFESRTAFPNLVSGGSGVTAALLAPAIQAARDAARRAQQQAGGAPAVPGAAPAPATAPPGAAPSGAPPEGGQASPPGGRRGRLDQNP